MLAWISLSALASDVWTDPFPGVRLLTRTTSDPNVVHAVVVDLCARGVSVRATKESEKERTTSSFGALVGAQVAINGDLFSYTDYYPSGMAIGAGAPWDTDNTSEGFAAFGDDRAWISPPSEVWDPPADWMDQAVGGRPLLVSEGVAQHGATSPLELPDVNPHTAVGLSEDRRTLWMVVVDGRSGSSIGLSCDGLADQLADLGAWTALSLDGGGSSDLWMDGIGVVNHPSDGVERTVSDHLAVLADGSGAPGSCDFYQGELSDQAHLLDTRNTDVDGDGKMDACGRSSAGFVCDPSTGTGFGADQLLSDLSDAAGWSDPSNARTIRMADVNGDGRADVCGRADDGVACWPSTGTGWGPKIDGPDLTDALGWADLAYGSTLRFGDYDGDGDDDLCARQADGVRCWPSEGAGFGAEISGPAWSDAVGFGTPDRYGPLLMGDIDGDGKADLCARTDAGMDCFLSDGSGFPTEVVGPAWSDAAGFTDVAAWSTIRLVDLDHDGRADLCARVPATGVECARSTGTAFGPVFAGPALTDASGWGDFGNAGTIRFGDVDGDGDEDLCARANAGMICWLYTGDAFAGRFDTTLLADAQGWDDPRYYTTIDLADVNGDGRADLCARAAVGMDCWPSDGASFGSVIAGPAWSDADGWDDPIHDGTIRLSGSYEPPPTHPTTDTDTDTTPTGSTSPTPSSTPSGSDVGPPTDRVPVDPGCGCGVPGSTGSRSTGSRSTGVWVVLIAAAGFRRSRRS